MELFGRSNWKSTHGLPIRDNTKFCSTFNCLTGIQGEFGGPVFGVTMGVGVQSGVSRNFDPTFLIAFNRNHRPILHRLATVHTVSDIL